MIKFWSINDIGMQRGQVAGGFMDEDEMRYSQSSRITGKVRVIAI